MSSPRKKAERLAENAERARTKRESLKLAALGGDEEKREELERKRERDRIQKQQRRKALRSNASALKEVRETTNLKKAEYLCRNDEKPYKGPNGLPGETCGDHRRRMDRELKRLKRLKDKEAKSKSSLNSDADATAVSVLLALDSSAGSVGDTLAPAAINSTTPAPRGQESGENDQAKETFKLRNKIARRIRLALEKEISTETELKLKAQLQVKRPDKIKKRLRDGRPDNYLQLEPQVSEEWCFKELMLFEISTEFGAVTKELCTEALEIELGPDVPDLVAPTLPSKDDIVNTSRWKHSKNNKEPDLDSSKGADKTAINDIDDDNEQACTSTDAQNRWNDLLEHESEDEENNKIVYSFNNLVQSKIEAESSSDEDEEQNVVEAIDPLVNVQVQIKMERESDEEFWEACHEDKNSCDSGVGVQNWIAQSIADEEKDNGGQKQKQKRLKKKSVKQSKKKKHTRTTRSSKSTAKKEIKEISSTETISELKEKLQHYKIRSLQKMRNDKMKKLQNQFESARERWRAQNPDEEDIRLKVDMERNTFKDKVFQEKHSLILAKKKELVKKREIFSKETLEERKARIQKLYEYARVNLNTKEIRAQKMKNSPGPTPVHRLPAEERKRIIAAAEKRKRHMAKAEFEFYNKLIQDKTKDGDPFDGPQLLQKFEELFVQPEYQQAIEFWADYRWRESKYKIEFKVLDYRKMLHKLLFRRIKRVTIDLPIDADNTTMVQRIPISEAQSQADFQEVYNFLLHHGQVVGDYITFRRNYAKDKIMGLTNQKLITMTPEEKARMRWNHNARLRKRYHKKHFNVDVPLGTYTPSRDPNRVKEVKLKKDGTPRRRRKPSDGPPTKPRAPRKKKSTEETLTPLSTPASIPIGRKLETVKTLGRKKKQTMTMLPPGQSIYNTSNDYYSNSSATSGAQQQTNEHDDMWTLMNLGAVVEIQQQQQQQQQQGLYQSNNFPSAQQSSSSQYVHSQSMPGLQLVNHNFTAQQQMSMGNSPYASQSEPGNFSLQFIQNQTNLSQQYASAAASQQQQQSGWNNDWDTGGEGEGDSSMDYDQGHDEYFSTSSSSSSTTGYQRKKKRVQPQIRSRNPQAQVRAQGHGKGQGRRGRPTGFRVQSSSRRMGQNALRRARTNRRKYVDKHGRIPGARGYGEEDPDPLPAVLAIDEFPFANIPQENLLPKCEQCGEVFDISEKLEKHKQEKHPPSLASEQPQADGLEASTSTAKENDLSTASKTDKPKITKTALNCPLCTSNFNDYWNFVYHVWKVHYVQKTYLCPLQTNKTCASKFQYSRHSLKRHIEKYHVEERANSTWIMGLETLATTVNAKKFMCLHCQKDNVFQSFTEFNKHYKQTHGKLRYCCKFCGILLREDNFLLDHIKLFHPEKNHDGVVTPIEVDEKHYVRCGTCDSDFSSQSCLNQHITQGHTLIPGEEDKSENTKNTRFTCSACGQETRGDDNREVHLKICPLRCQWCTGVMKSKAEMSKHLSEKHPNEPLVPKDQSKNAYNHQPYHCELCKSAFITLHDLRQHFITSHKLYKYLNSLKEKGLITPPRDPETILKSAAAGVEAKTSKNVKPSQISTPRIHKCSSCSFTTDSDWFHFIHLSYDRVMNRFCAPCNTIFPRQDDFFQHNETEHGINPSSWKAPKTSGTFGGRNKTGDFVCATCDLEFTPEEFHNFHQIAEQDTNMKTCKYCSRKFFNNNLLGKHYHADHAIPKRDRNLKNNPKSISNPPRQLTLQDFDMLTLVTNIPSGGKSEAIPIYTCKACLNNYKTQDFVRAHIAEVHKEDAFTRVLCKQCHISFKDAKNLRLHNQVHHKPNSTRYICPICSIVTLLPKRHLKEKHPDAKITMADLKEVPLDQVEKKQFPCSVCSTDFKTEKGLKSHMTTKHFPIHFTTFCSHCGLQLNPKSIKKHEEKHHPSANAADESATPKLRKGLGGRILLTLIEVAEMIQTAYESSDVDSTKIANYHKSRFPKGRGRGGGKLASKRKKTKSVNNASKRKRKSSSKRVLSESEEEISESDSSNDDDAQNSDSDSGDGIDNESDDGDDAFKDIIVGPKKKKTIPVKRPTRASVSNNKRQKLESSSEESNTESDSEFEINPSTSRQKTLPKRKVPTSLVVTKAVAEMNKDLEMKLQLNRCDEMAEQFKKNKDASTDEKESDTEIFQEIKQECFGELSPPPELNFY